MVAPTVVLGAAEPHQEHAGPGLLGHHVVRNGVGLHDLARPPPVPESARREESPVHRDIPPSPLEILF